MATYAIGDVQGCYAALRRLLDHIGFDRFSDQLWLVGDLVNRGPDSLKVLRFVRSLEGAARVVLGNHDLHLIMLAAGYGKGSSEDTLDEVLRATDADELLTWLRSCPLCYRQGEYLLVHAGLLPQWTAQQAMDLSSEVSAALQSADYRVFLANMWGSEPDYWYDELSGWERLRVIVNAMTRMRFVRAGSSFDQCAMELRAAGAKGTLADAPFGCLPWFEVPGRLSASVTVICGHWSALGLVVRDNLLALDTGCLWGGVLTALRLEDRRVFQQPCAQLQKPGIG